MKFLDIGEVSRKTGVAPSALRYYEEIGLITPVARRGLRRQFAPEVLLQLKLVALAKMAGFTLEEISGMFGGNGAMELPRDRLHERAADIERQVLDLSALAETIRHIANCPAPSHLECPTFRRILDGALAAGRPAVGR